MTGILTAGERTSAWGTIGDLARRVARLEAVPASTSANDENAVHFNDTNTELTTRYLSVVANDDIPADDASIHLETGGAVGDFDIIAGSIGNLTLTATGGSVQIEADAGVVAVVASSDVNLLPGGDLNIVLQAGQTFTVKDSGGNPILQMTEGSPDLHIPAGGTLVADL